MYRSRPFVAVRFLRAISTKTGEAEQTRAAPVTPRQETVGWEWKAHPAKRRGTQKHSHG